MLLTVDIGNSSIAIGTFLPEKAEPVFTAKLAVQAHRSADEYAILLQSLFQMHSCLPGDVTGIALASVVPQLTHNLTCALKHFLPERRLISVGPGVKSGIGIRTDAPAELGADIVANAAAVAMMGSTPAIIADLGTATTLFALDEQHCLTGGVIIPGVRTALDGLHSATAQLPYVALQPVQKTVGKNTPDCIRAGIVIGHALMLDGFVEQMESELGFDNEKTVLYATGGLAPLIAAQCRHSFRIEPYLTMKGLRTIFENTCPGKKCGGR